MVHAPILLVYTLILRKLGPITYFIVPWNIKCQIHHKMSAKLFLEWPRQYITKTCINFTSKNNNITPMLRDKVSFFGKTNVPQSPWLVVFFHCVSPHGLLFFSIVYPPMACCFFSLCIPSTKFIIPVQTLRFQSLTNQPANI